MFLVAVATFKVSVSVTTFVATRWLRLLSATLTTKSWLTPSALIGHWCRQAREVQLALKLLTVTVTWCLWTLPRPASVAVARWSRVALATLTYNIEGLMLSAVRVLLTVGSRLVLVSRRVEVPICMARGWPGWSVI